MDDLANNPGMSPRSTMPEFYLLLAKSGMFQGPRSSMPEFYLLLANSGMSPRSSMPEFYLLTITSS